MQNPNPSQIEKLITEKFHPRGNPTIEVDVILKGGLPEEQQFLQGHHPGVRSVELRDGDKRYNGKGVLKQ